MMGQHRRVLEGHGCEPLLVLPLSLGETLGCYLQHVAARAIRVRVRPAACRSSGGTDSTMSKVIYNKANGIHLAHERLECEVLDLVVLHCCGHQGLRLLQTNHLQRRGTITQVRKRCAIHSSMECCSVCYSAHFMAHTTVTPAWPPSEATSGMSNGRCYHSKPPLASAILPPLKAFPPGPSAAHTRRHGRAAPRCTQDAMVVQHLGAHRTPWSCSTSVHTGRHGRAAPRCIHTIEHIPQTLPYISPLSSYPLMSIHRLPPSSHSHLLFSTVDLMGCYIYLEYIILYNIPGIAWRNGMDATLAYTSGLHTQFHALFYLRPAAALLRSAVPDSSAPSPAAATPPTAPCGCAQWKCVVYART